MSDTKARIVEIDGKHYFEFLNTIPLVDFVALVKHLEPQLNAIGYDLGDDLIFDLDEEVDEDE